MFHSILTILTTAAVALHATLGCCAHHSHSCDVREAGLQTLAAADHCAHGHHHHEDDGDSPNDERANGCGHESEGGEHHGCDEGDCSFTSSSRSSDGEWMLAFSVWSQAIGDVADAKAFDSLSSLSAAAEIPPDPLMDAGSARAMTQVWRL